jgi:hypothetical protein
MILRINEDYLFSINQLIVAMETCCAFFEVGSGLDFCMLFRQTNNDQIKENEVGGTCGTHERGEECVTKF